MLENENKVIWERYEQDKKAGVIDEEDKGKKDSVLKKEYNEIAERRVRLGLLLAEVGDQNKITVTDEEIKAAVMQEARKYPGEENKVIEFYQKNPEAANAVRAPIFEEKVVDHIISKCTIKENKVSADKLFEDNVIPDPTTKASSKAKSKKTITKKSSTKNTKKKSKK
jgi:trigger factor